MIRSLRFHQRDNKKRYYAGWLLWCAQQATRSTFLRWRSHHAQSRISDIQNSKKYMLLYALQSAHAARMRLGFTALQHRSQLELTKIHSNSLWNVRPRGRALQPALPPFYRTLRGCLLGCRWQLRSHIPSAVLCRERVRRLMLCDWLWQFWLTELLLFCAPRPCVRVHSGGWLIETSTTRWSTTVC